MCAQATDATDASAAGTTATAAAAAGAAAAATAVDGDGVQVAGVQAQLEFLRSDRPGQRHHYSVV